MQSQYSYCGSRLVLLLEDDTAAAYNRAVDAFLDAQQRYKEMLGVSWNGNSPLLMDISKADLEVFNSIADIINTLSKINGGGIDISEEEMTDDGFVKVDVSIKKVEE